MSSRVRTVDGQSAPQRSPSSDRTPVFVESIGTTLRREREVRAMSLEEVAQVTRIPLRSLRLLEQDELSALPGDVFARGFVTSYARALGLEAGEQRSLLARLGDAPEASAPPRAAMSRDAGTGEPRLAKRAGMAVAVIVLAALFATAVAVMLTPRRTQHTPRPLSAAPAAASSTHA